MTVSPLARLTLPAATVCWAAATGLAALLARQALTGASRLPGCGGAADCAVLAASSWAHLGPVPVALPAVTLYALALGGLLALEPVRAAGATGRERLAWAGLATLSFVFLGATLWFAGVQSFVLHRYCTLCLATHLCASLGSLLVLRLAVGALESTHPGWWRGPALTAAGLLGLLVAGQLALLGGSRPAASPAAVTSQPAAVSVLSPGGLPGKLGLVRGRVQLAAAAYPVLGATAPPRQIVVVMFDYTCAACRANHAQLGQALARPGSGLAVMLVPTPLDPACNPAVARLRPEHVHACEYARYALAVWRAAPERFAAYDAWLMAGGGEQPPPVEEARRRAEAAVGTDALARALTAVDAAGSLRRAGLLYQSLEAGEIPKLLLPDAVLSGGFSSAAKLEAALQQLLPPSPVPR